MGGPKPRVDIPDWEGAQPTGVTGPEAFTLQEERLRPREAEEVARTSEQTAELERVPGIVPNR